MKQQNKYNLVLIGGQYKYLLGRINAFSEELNIIVTKVTQSHIYFDIKSDLSLTETIRQIKITIYQDRNTWEMHFQIYGFFNGKIDFLSYVSEETKKEMKYYQ